ncbi:MAG: hypothetical protein KGK11_10980 [Sphingomonadales bacterium]|nr:hypothetical protein [Sphingomonadales bacterium]
MRHLRSLFALFALLAAAFGAGWPGLAAQEQEAPVARHWVKAPDAPASQSEEQVAAKSAGCLSCHTRSDASTMHSSPAVRLGCTDCHGGDASVRGDAAIAFTAPANVAARERAHVLPRYPGAWNYPSSANPRQSYTLLNREAPEFIRFVNPGDYRVAREACGACHLPIIEAAERSLMATGAMLWGGGAYNNGIVPFKSYVFGEAYTRDGKSACIGSPSIVAATHNPCPPPTVLDGNRTLTEAELKRGALASLYPLPSWQVTPPSDVFRVFERGGRDIATQFPEIGLPNDSGSIQRLEEPGRPDLKQSNRGPGTGLRVAIPVLNITKTRLNDPFMWFLGTNDQPGDYRSSGCSGCHVVYANDREPRHSLIYAQYGRDGQTITSDPTIASQRVPARPGQMDEADAGGMVRESGHPLQHVFTRSIPTAQCMNCHMHQPNIFLNSYLGYTMWDYESDAPAMWPEKQKYPTAAETRATNERNPEGAADRGKWADLDFLRNVYSLNPKLKNTQFADYHGHGWNFRAVYKHDREGNLLDAEGNMASYGTDTKHIIAWSDPEKWRRNGVGMFAPVGVNPGKAVHLMDIHAEKGLQCADCHYAQDSHGTGFIYGEVANAIEIGCKDCHGTVDAYPNLRTSGPAAPPHGTDLSLLRNPDGKRRFEWQADAAGHQVLIQRSVVDPKLEWRIHLVKDSVDPASPDFNPKSARAKLMSRSGAQDGSFAFGPGIARTDRAHDDSKMACFTCHLSWTTSCAGCHLPIEANWKTSMHHFEGETTRNFATYNPQVARDDMFQLGRHMTTKGSEITPVRSTSALVLSSTNINRERIYVQQPPISAIGFSSQAFAPHFPHTVRTQETKTCTDCHLSRADDNNAIMAQLLLLGTNYVNFVGMNAWTGLEHGIEAVRVTEWKEPQAVIGSYLQKYAYPDYYRLHVEQNHRELRNWVRGKTFNAKLSGETDPIEEFRNPVHATADRVGCIQMRGEYLYVAEGKGGLRVYDIAAIADKGFSEPIVSAPFSPLGQHDAVKSPDATCVALPTNQSIAPTRNTALLRQINQEQDFLPIYHYAAVTDSAEGLILVNVDTLADGDFRNNFLHRAVTWNPDNVLKGARHVILAGEIAYVTADVGLVVVDLHDPLHPRLAAVRPLTDARASALQFRYLWVTDRDGLKLFDVTDMRNPVAIPQATVPIANARKLYVARTYAYVAAKADGLVIVNVTRPLSPVIYQKVTFGGQMNDAEDVIVGSTNASLFAYVADGRNGMKVIQLTSPESQPDYYGFSPRPVPELIAWARTPSPALAMSKGLDRDRAVDETGGQIAVFGRLGSRPFTRPEMEALFLDSRKLPYKVSDEVDWSAWRGPALSPGARSLVLKDR